LSDNLNQVPSFVRAWQARRFPPGVWMIEDDCALLIGSTDPEKPADNDNKPVVR
jgi:hypothetical protein